MEREKKSSKHKKLQIVSNSSLSYEQKVPVIYYYIKKTNQKKSEILLNRFIFNSYDFSVFTLVAFAIAFYNQSLVGCEGTQVECLNKLKPRFFFALFFDIFLSSLCICISLFLIFFKYSNIYHLLYLIPLVYQLITKDLGSDLKKHGSYNLYGFILISSLLLIISFILNFLYYLLRHFHIKFMLILIIASLIIGKVSIYDKYSTNCFNFYNGLGGEKATHDPSSDLCKMFVPKRCILNSMSGLFDISYFIGKHCERGQIEKTNFIKYLFDDLKNTRNFAFPLTVDMELKGQTGIPQFNEKVLNQVVDIDKNFIDHEVELRFDEKGLGTININVQKDKFIARERKEIRINNNIDHVFPNILFIYIDAISRNHFLRKMKKTSEFIERYLYSSKDENEPYDSKTLSSFQFFKYNTFNSYTQINVQPMFYGASMFSNGGRNIIKDFKDRGYITGQSSNLCSKEVFAVERHFHTSDIEFHNFDHENIAMFCDPNYYDREDPYPLNRGPFSLLRRCLYGKDTFDYVIEYTEKFWEAYKNEPKFFRMAFIDAHEPSGEVVAYLDAPLRAFLDRFQEKGYLKDTFIFFISDHGNNMGEFYNILGNDFRFEKSLGSLFIMVPHIKDKEIENEILQSLSYNQNKFMTPYDIHDTMMDIIYFYDEDKARHYSKYGQSLFKPIDGLKRSCDNYNDDKIGFYCRCYKSE